MAQNFLQHLLLPTIPAIYPVLPCSHPAQGLITSKEPHPCPAASSALLLPHTCPSILISIFIFQDFLTPLPIQKEFIPDLHPHQQRRFQLSMPAAIPSILQQEFQLLGMRRDSRLAFQDLAPTPGKHGLMGRTKSERTSGNKDRER